MANLVSGRIPSAQDFAISLPQHLSEVWTRRSNNYRALSDKCKAQCHFFNRSESVSRVQYTCFIFRVTGGVDTFEEVIRTYLVQQHSFKCNSKHRDDVWLAGWISIICRDQSFKDQDIEIRRLTNYIYIHQTTTFSTNWALGYLKKNIKHLTVRS